MAKDHKQSDSTKALLTEATSLDNSKKNLMSDVVGMPDDVDKDYIQRLLLKYEKVHPGWIKFTRDKAREQVGSDNLEFALTSGSASRKGKFTMGANTRYLLELPAELHEAIESYIPTMFRDQKHFYWFCKNFRELLIPEKY